MRERKVDEEEEETIVPLKRLKYSSSRIHLSSEFHQCSPAGRRRAGGEEEEEEEEEKK